MPFELLLVNTNQMKPPVAPIGLDYIADALVAAGFQVRILDLCWVNNIKTAIEQTLKKASPRLIGLSVRNTDDCYFASQQSFVDRVGEIVDSLKGSSDAPVVLGGAGFSTIPAATVARCGADFGIIGDGESGLVALAGALAAGEDPRELPGLVYWHEGVPVVNPPQFPPLPAGPRSRSNVDNKRYFTAGGQGGLETKRGCPGGCIYCADPLGKGRNMRLRAPRDVADEVETLLAQGLDCLHICDSEFNIPYEHAVAVCAELTDRGLGDSVRWYTYAAPVPFTPELARAMRRAGCVGINFGADSGNAQMLRRLGREHSPEDLRMTAEICRSAGITFMYDLLLGGPGETRETLRETIELMKELEPDCVGVSAGIRIYPGTQMERIVRCEGPLAQNPNLQGRKDRNDDLLLPVFYVAAEVGPDINGYVRELVGGDPRFFIANDPDDKADYNYSDNQLLVDAIRQGHRGAYWDILRRIRN